MRGTSLLIILVVCFDTCSATSINTYALNHTCSPPVSQGGKGYCGPAFCDVSASTAAGCVFTNTVYNYTASVAGTRSKTCTQSTDARCTSAALSALMIGQGIKAAYCNDQFLVIQTDTSTGFPNYLASIKNPPGAVAGDGTACVTRYVNTGFQTIKIPLYPTLLATADASVNNVNTNSYPNGPGDIDGAYISSSTPGTTTTYGLPTRGKSISNLNHLEPQRLDFSILSSHQPAFLYILDYIFTRCGRSLDCRTNHLSLLQQSRLFGTSEM